MELLGGHSSPCTAPIAALHLLRFESVTESQQKSTPPTVRYHTSRVSLVPAAAAVPGASQSRSSPQTVSVLSSSHERGNRRQHQPASFAFLSVSLPTTRGRAGHPQPPTPFNPQPSGRSPLSSHLSTTSRATTPYLPISTCPPCASPLSAAASQASRPSGCVTRVHANPQFLKKHSDHEVNIYESAAQVGGQARGVVYRRE
jgi:hypothetical protein